MPASYADPPGTHRHKCWFCGYIWAHADACRDLPTVEERDAAHACPGCTRDNRFIYAGPLGPESWHPKPEET